MITHSGPISCVLLVDMAALLMYNLSGMCVTGMPWSAMLVPKCWPMLVPYVLECLHQCVEASIQRQVSHAQPVLFNLAALSCHSSWAAAMGTQRPGTRSPCKPRTISYDQ